MSRFPSLPLFTDAFLADTMHLSAQETGAYLLLLMTAWRSPGCRLPDDDIRLAKYARLDRRTWTRVKATIMEFWTLSDGFWSQKRLTKEHDFVSKRAEVNRVNGAAGGRPKSLKTNGAANPAGSSRVSEKNPPNPNPNPIEERVELTGERVEPEPSRASARGSPPKGSRLPDDFALTEEMLAFALEEGFSHEQAQREFARFCDYWWSASGANAAKRNWDSAWRNWVRKAADGFGKPSGNHARGNGRSADSILGAFQRAAARTVN